MKNQEQVQWSVLPNSAEVLRLVLEICLLFKNVIDVLLFSGVVLVSESTHCYNLCGVLRIYHD